MLALILFSFFQDKPKQFTFEEVMDRHFIVAEEESIYQFGEQKNLDLVLSPNYVKFIRNLGCNRYDCREAASEYLYNNINTEGLRAIVWGSHHKDPEIANRCSVLLVRLLPCLHCYGSGNCPNRPEAPQHVICEPCQKIYSSTHDPMIDNVYKVKGCVVCMATGCKNYDYTPTP